jgi:hypothetical protein
LPPQAGFKGSLLRPSGYAGQAGVQDGWRFQRSGFRCQGACRRSNLMLFVLVLVLVLEKRKLVKVIAG